MTDKTLQDRLRDPSHGFDRNDSHTEDRYVCLCEHLANEAADALDAQAERIKALEVALRVLVRDVEAVCDDLELQPAIYQARALLGDK